jgi:hypothetical protein
MPQELHASRLFISLTAVVLEAVCAGWSDHLLGFDYAQANPL